MATREELEAEILKNDPNEDRNSEAFKAQLVLLASATEGTTSIKRLSEFTGVPRNLVAKFSHNLRRNGVWRGNKIYADWCDEKEGGMAFMLDTLVATGMLERAH